MPTIHMTRVARRAASAVIGGAAALGLAAAPAVAAGPPAGLPGPPPSFGQGLPLPPPPGQGPPAQGNQPATTISGTPYGPGLLTSSATVSGRKLPVKIACQGNGRGQLRAGSVAVKTTYKCSGGHSTVSFPLTKSQASAITHSANLTGALTLQQGGSTVHLSLFLGRSTPAPNFWISAFGLSCPGGGGTGNANLLAPNFSATQPTTVDVRPWLAWYTTATGWQWLGTLGPDQSAWYRWTATPGGVAEWQQGGNITPWTWGPITVAPGHGTYVISVFEAIYWYGHPNDVWEYVHSEPTSTSTTTYCVYP
jgi:hypothetical protein